MTATTPDAPAAFNFEDATEPARETSSAPNPFSEVVAALPVDSPKRAGKTFAVPAGVKLSVVRSQLDRAADVVGVTVRWTLTDPETDKRVKFDSSLVGPMNVFIRATHKVKARRTAAPSES